MRWTNTKTKTSCYNRVEWMGGCKQIVNCLWNICGDKCCLNTELRANSCPLFPCVCKGHHDIRFVICPRPWVSMMSLLWVSMCSPKACQLCQKHNMNGGNEWRLWERIHLFTPRIHHYRSSRHTDGVQLLNTNFCRTKKLSPQGSIKYLSMCLRIYWWEIAYRK